MTHGLSILKRAFKVRGTRAIDGRTTAGKALRAWQAALIAELGGPTALSAAELARVDHLMQTKFMLERLDIWLLTRSSLIAPRGRGLLPALRNHRRLANAMMRDLQALARARRKRPGPTFYEYLVAKYGPDTTEGVGTDVAHPARPTAAGQEARTGTPNARKRPRPRTPGPTTAKAETPEAKQKSGTGR